MHDLEKAQKEAAKTPEQRYGEARQRALALETVRRRGEEERRRCLFGSSPDWPPPRTTRGKRRARAKERLDHKRDEQVWKNLRPSQYGSNSSDEGERW